MIRIESKNFFLMGLKSIFCFMLPLLLAVTEVCFGEELFWLDGRLPPKSKSEGAWFWDEEIRHNGVASHTDGIGGGPHSHSFTTETTVKLDNDSRIIQHVLLDAENPPSGIMLIFFTGEDEEFSVYWEGEEEVFKDEYIRSWYMGYLPKSGQWSRLQIDCKELDIGDKRLNGVSYITNEGRTWWGRTVITSRD